MLTNPRAESLAHILSSIKSSMKNEDEFRLAAYCVEMAWLEIVHVLVERQGAAPPPMAKRMQCRNEIDSGRRTLS